MENSICIVYRHLYLQPRKDTYMIEVDPENAINYLTVHDTAHSSASAICNPDVLQALLCNHKHDYSSMI